MLICSIIFYNIFLKKLNKKMGGPLGTARVQKSARKILAWGHTSISVPLLLIASLRFGSRTIPSLLSHRHPFMSLAFSHGWPAGYSYSFILGFARLRVLMSGSLVQATHTRTEQNTTGEARQTNPKAGRIYLFFILVKKARLPFAARYHSPSALRRTSEAFYGTSVP